MLEYIRSNSQSLGVKLAFGLIILVFVFWGVGSLQNTTPVTLIATVNGEPITIVEFEQAYAQARDSVRRDNPNLTAQQIQQMQLPQQVLQQLMLGNLIQQEAKRLDIAVSDAELRLAIEQIPSFRNAEGVFDAELYKRLVTAQGQRLSDFEAMVKAQILEAKLRNGVTSTGNAFTKEVEAFFNFTYEQRDIEYLFFPASDALAKLGPIAEDSVKSYYESNRAQFAIPAKASVDYISVSPIDIVKPESIASADVDKYYADNKDKFSTPARSKVRHILLMLPQDAPEEDVKKATESMSNIEKELQDGADFAELAKKYSEDTATAVNGGDIDWVSPGDTVKAFNDAVFSMQAGDVSKPVRSEFGLHLIKVDEVEAAATKALSEVESVIRTELAQENGAVKLREVLDNLIEANILGKNLADAAKAQGLELKKSELLTALELEDLLKISAEGSAQIFATAAGVPLDAALSSGDNAYVVVRVAEKEASSTRPLDEVKANIEKILLEKNAMEATKAEVAEVLKTLEASTPEEFTSRVKAIANVQRTSDVGELGAQPDMSLALFAAKPNVWLPSVYTATVDGELGAVLVRVAKVNGSQEAQVDGMEEIIGNVLSMQRKEKMFQLFVASLSEKAEFEILNEQYLNMLATQ